MQFGSVFYVPVRFDGHDDVRTLRLHRMSKVELLDTSSGIDQFDLDEWIEAGGMGFGGQEQIELIPASSPKGRAGLGMRIFRMSLPDGGSSSPCAPPGVIAMTVDASESEPMSASSTIVTHFPRALSCRQVAIKRLGFPQPETLFDQRIRLTFAQFADCVGVSQCPATHVRRFDARRLQNGLDPPVDGGLVETNALLLTT